jgi:hypothetical protein
LTGSEFASHSFSEGRKYSQAAIHALAVQIQQNRPRLSTLLSVIYHLSEGERFTRDMGLITDDLDLSLGVKEAARDGCIWASMERKWQEHTKRGC